MAITAAALLLCGCLLATGCASNSSSKSEDVQQKLEEYAQLLVSKGMVVKQGDTVAIISPIDAADFARMCIDAAYGAGAANVLVYWDDPKANQSRLTKASEEALSTTTEAYAAFYNECYKTRASYLRIESPDPGASEGVTAERYALDSAAQSAAQADYRPLRLSHAVPWVIAGYPNKEWAELVFPDKQGDEAVCALLDAILKTVYVTGDGTSAQTWNSHIAELQSRATQLDEYNFASLRYTNSQGTDLTVQLPEGHIWNGGDNTTPDGTHFVANMPTEEIFSAPLKTGVNGTLVSSKPLVINGQVIDGIKLTLKDGKIVEATASQGQDILVASLDTDEGSRYLGEVSLVPFDSPISNSGLLFYNTLYDENASCHFAFGSSFSSCIANGEALSKEELLSRGMNQSGIHVDFMVGTADLSVIGTTHDGTEVVVFKDGNFAF